MWIMRATDRIADWLMEELDARAQLRWGVWLALLSLPIYAYAPFSGEPIVIYLMSALALTLTGISIILGAEVLEQTEDAEESAEEAADHCQGCTCDSAGEECVDEHPKGFTSH
jgi:hypothetical protein